MILLRGIKGHEYAIKMQDGIVGCRDLFTTLVGSENSGYAFTDYYEKYFAEMFYYMKNIAGNIDDANKIAQLALDEFVPYIYMTYFHIMNEDSEKWVEDNFEDDCEFIYYIPKLDGLTGQLIERDFFGDKIKYVKNINEFNVPQNSFINYGIMNKIDRSSLQAAKITSVVACVYNMLLYPLFFRVVDEKYNETENEFRIFTIKNCKVTINGEIVYDNPRTFQLMIDDEPYEGKVITIGAKNNIINQKDMKLTPRNKKIVPVTDSLAESVVHKRNISYISDFMEICVRGTSSGFGYIGGKEECIDFIKKNRKSFYYLNNKTRQRVVGHDITSETSLFDYHFMPPWQMIQYEQLIKQSSFDK